MKNIIEGVNHILAEWDPLGVGENIAKDEYKRYIPLILKDIKSKRDLTVCLENILINNLEVGYDKENNEHKYALNKIVEKIMQLYLERK
ncbi:hypothetical protein [Chitinophaga sp. HK235]|uniref:hypothetical protein n=1 Tax=Chitinophaga sp. HK235 TaxID=2952571 RepID=UPI001BA51027|nr:hypothetical protein [Chitinophaga sp. HK235]